MRALLLGGLLLFGSLVGLTVVEVGLRSQGYEPWRPLAADRGEPAMVEEDAALGWRNRPGRHAFPSFVEGAPPTQVTILPDGSRATGEGGQGAERPALVR